MVSEAENVPKLFPRLRPNAPTEASVLVGTVIVVAAVVVGGLIWRQWSELDRNRHLYQYHLPSAWMAEELEMDAAQLSLQAEWQDRFQGQFSLEFKDSANGNEKRLLYSIEKEVELLAETEARFGEELSGVLLEKILDINEILRSSINETRSTEEERIRQLGQIASVFELRAEQLARYHRKRFEEGLAAGTLQRRQANIILLAVFVAVLSGGLWLVFLLLRQIASGDRELRNNQALIAGVADNVPGGVFRCTVDAEMTFEVSYQSEGLSEVLGMQGPIDAEGWDKALDSLHPEDRVAMMKNVKRSSQSLESFEFDFRLHIRNQGYRWRRVVASVGRDQFGAQIWTGLVLDVDEQKEAEEGLRASMLIAEDANRSKSRFLASMSHEIRTPMNAVLGFAQIMESSSGDDLSDRQRECIHQIMTGGHHLLSLIDDVLDLSRIESGKADISLARVEPYELVDVCLILVESLASGHNVKLVKPSNLGDVPDVWADETRLRQVLLNLLSNAVKYNRTGGSVMLSVSSISPGMVRFEVKDTGEGVSPDLVDELFKPFSRLGREALNIEGTGIGLVISKMLMEQMNGHIGYETAPGEGSTFWFDIPVADESVPDLELIEANEVNVATGTSGQNTILYIEDNPSNVELIKRLVLDEFDVSFISAPDGEIGLTLAKQIHPDLVLLDLNLPGIDGYQVLRKLQEMDETRDSPIIALTALAMDEDIRRGAEAGFSNYITKPFDIRDVQEKIQAALDSKRIAIS